MKTPVSPIIENDEVLARGIVHPLMYSKSKKRLKENAFKPPPGRNDVSVLRLRYTDADFCKKHFKTLVVGFHVYCGIALLKVGEARNVPSNIFVNNEERDLPKLEVSFTPLNAAGNYRNDAPVLAEDAGLPMHADIVFGFVPELEKPAPLWVRKISRALAKEPPAKFFGDTKPEDEKWTGEALQL